MFLYKDNRFYLNNISFCLPENVYLNTDCEEYDNCIELLPNGEDFRIIIFGEHCDGGAKQFFGKDEAKECYREVGDIMPFTVNNVAGYSRSYKSTYNTYTEYRFDIEYENDTNVLGILICGKISDVEIESIKHQSVITLLQSLKTQ